MANPNPNPKSRFRGAVLKTLIRDAAAEASFVERVPVLDAEGRAPSLVFYVFWRRNRLSASNRLVPAYTVQSIANTQP